MHSSSESPRGLQGESIYGEKFADESFAGKAGKHTGFGCLSMANAGPNTNGSQFFVCLAHTPWLDGRHVVFGKLANGAETVKQMEQMGSESGQTSKAVAIAECGECCCCCCCCRSILHGGMACFSLLNGHLQKKALGGAGRADSAGCIASHAGQLS
jgi:hypothetical protein